MSTTIADDVTVLPEVAPRLAAGRPAMRLARDDERIAGDAFSADLRAISVAHRVLANRIAELESEVGRQAAVAEQLRQRLATTMADDLQHLTSSCAEELAALKATRLFRWSAAPRRAYGWLRRRGRSGR